MLQIERETFSPGVLQKVVLTATETKSYERAERGQQLIDEQHRRAVRHEHQQWPMEVSNPTELAVVEMDGGRTVRTAGLRIAHRTNSLLAWRPAGLCD